MSRPAPKLLALQGGRGGFSYLRHCVLRPGGAESGADPARGRGGRGCRRCIGNRQQNGSGYARCVPRSSQSHGGQGSGRTSTAAKRLSTFVSPPRAQSLRWCICRKREWVQPGIAEEKANRRITHRPALECTVEGPILTNYLGNKYILECGRLAHPQLPAPTSSPCASRQAARRSPPRQTRRPRRACAPESSWTVYGGRGYFRRGPSRACPGSSSGSSLPRQSRSGASE